MPEHQDPISTLENFGNGGIVTTPLEPGAVRRLGDKRRVRRNSFIATAAAAVVIAAVVPTALIATRDDGSSPPPAGGSSATPTPTPTPTTAAVVPEVITYPGNGIFVSNAEDVAKLTGTTAKFKSFVMHLAEQANTDGEGCPDAAHGITVQKYSTKGYAMGGVNSCGGYATLWGIREGTWQEAAGTQDTWDCDSLRFFNIPKSFAGQCANEAGLFGPTDLSGIKLGMTPAQVVDAGGTVGGKDTDTCRAVEPQYRSPLPNRSDVVLSSKYGVAGIFARPGDLTPKGIALGSTAADVKKAYPNGHDAMGYWDVPLGGGHRYQFLLGNAGIVSEMNMSLDFQDCFG